MKKVKKNSLYLGGDIERMKGNTNNDNGMHTQLISIDSERISKTILTQANLVPLSYLTQPIYWDFGEVLNLNTTPDYLILADTCGQFTVEESQGLGTTVINPGNFSCSKTFSIIYPHQGKVEENCLQNEEE